MLCVCVCVCTHELGSMFSDYLSCLWSADWVLLTESSCLLLEMWQKQKHVVSDSQWSMILHSFCCHCFLSIWRLKAVLPKHTFCTKMLQSNWRLKAIVPLSTFCSKMAWSIDIQLFYCWVMDFEFLLVKSAPPTSLPIPLISSPIAFAWIPKLLEHES